jgi:hypothetical protein
MVDTVRFFQPHELFEHAGLRPGWRSRPSIVQDELSQKQTFALDHLATGYWTSGERGHTLRHCASLPRFLFGNNAKLIQDQAQLDASLAKLFEKATELGRPTTEAVQFTRVDLVWQFQVDIQLFIQAHRNSRHSRIRSDPFLYEKRSLIFKGSEVKIRMYDKLREMFKNKRNGNVLRVEVELHGDRLKEELGGGEQVTSLNFDQCYQAFRHVMIGFEPPPVPNAGGIAEVLATGMREGWTAGGVPFFEWYTRNMSVRNISRLRRQIEALRPTFYQIDWSKLLPADGPPPPVEV